MFIVEHTTGTAKHQKKRQPELHTCTGYVHAESISKKELTLFGVRGRPMHLAISDPMKPNPHPQMEEARGTAG